MSQFVAFSDLLEKIRVAHENCCSDRVSQRCPHVIVTNLTDAQPHREADSAGIEGQEGLQLSDVIRVATCGKCCSARGEQQLAPGRIRFDVTEVRQHHTDAGVRGEKQEVGHDHADYPRTSEHGNEKHAEHVLEKGKKTSLKKSPPAANQDTHDKDLGANNRHGLAHSTQSHSDPHQDDNKERHTNLQEGRHNLRASLTIVEAVSIRASQTGIHNGNLDFQPVDTANADNENPDENPEEGPSIQESSGRKPKKDPNFNHENSFDTGQRTSLLGPQPTEDSPLIVAVKLAKVEDIRNVLRHSPELINLPDMHRQTPIFWAVRQGNMTVLQMLLRAKAKVQVANTYGYTPLMRAVHYGQLEVCEKLLALRAALEAFDKFNGTAIQVAATAGQVQALKWLLSKPSPNLLKTLVNNKDKQGRTPLHVAAKNGHSTAVYLLLEGRAEPNTRDCHGRPPLLFSLARNDVLAVHSLIHYQAHLNLRNSRGVPLLHVLVDHLCQNNKRHDSLCGLVTILQAKADVDERDSTDLKPVMHAVRGNQTMVCAVLAAFRADLKNLSGIARACGYFEMASVLDEFIMLRSNTYANSPAALALQSFRQQVKDVSALYEELAYALSVHKAEFVVEKLNMLLNSAVDLKLENMTMTTVLQDFLDIQRKFVVDVSLRDLREVRLRQREEQFLKFKKEMLEWHERDALDPKGLQSVIGDGVKGLQSCKLTSMELADAHTKALEDIQTGLIDDLFRHLLNLGAVVYDERNAWGFFPEREHKLELHELQCPKCLLRFPHQKILADHMTYCFSRAAADLQKQYKSTRSKKADIGIRRLEDAVESYEDRIRTFESVLDKVQTTLHACKKHGLQGAMIPLKACASFLESTIRLLTIRRSKCVKATQDAIKEWFPNGRESATSMGVICGVCLVEPATRIATHFDIGFGEKVSDHPVACTPCAVVMQNQLGKGNRVICPKCKAPVRGFRVDLDEN